MSSRQGRWPTAGGPFARAESIAPRKAGTERDTSLMKSTPIQASESTAARTFFSVIGSPLEGAPAGEGGGRPPATTMRGPGTLPARIESRSASTGCSPIRDPMSRIPVTPLARCSAPTRSSDRYVCACISQRPGITNDPVPSTRRARAGTTNEVAEATPAMWFSRDQGRLVAFPLAGLDVDDGRVLDRDGWLGIKVRG